MNAKDQQSVKAAQGHQVFNAMSDLLWERELGELQDLWDMYNYLYRKCPERVRSLRHPKWGRGRVNRCVKGIRRRPSADLPGRAFRPRTFFPRTPPAAARER